MDAERRDDEVRYVDAAVTPSANYVSRATGPLGMGPIVREERPPLRGHVHVRPSDRCIHRDAGPLCQPLDRS